MARIPRYIADSRIPADLPRPQAESGPVVGPLRATEARGAQLAQDTQRGLEGAADFFMRQQAAKDAADVHTLNALSMERLDAATDAIRRTPDYTTHLTRWQAAFKAIQDDILEKAPNDAVKSGVNSRLLTLYVQRVKQEREYQGALFKDQARAQLNTTVEKFLLAGERDPLLGTVPGQEEAWLAEIRGPLSDAVATGVITAQEKQQHEEIARKRLIGGWADREMLGRPVQTMLDAEAGVGLFSNAGAEQRRTVATRARAEWRRQEEELRTASAAAEKEQKKRQGDNFTKLFDRISAGEDVMRDAVALAAQRELDPDKLESLRKMVADQRGGRWEDDVNVRSALEKRVELGQASLDEVYAAVRPGGISAATGTAFANILRAERHRAEDKSLALLHEDTRFAQAKLKTMLAHDALIPFLNSIEREKRLEVLSWANTQLRLRTNTGQPGTEKRPWPGVAVDGIIDEANALLGQKTALELDRVRRALGPYTSVEAVLQAERDGRLPPPTPGPDGRPRHSAEAQSKLDLLRLMDQTQRSQLGPVYGPQNEPGAKGNAPAERGGGFFDFLHPNPNRRPSGPPPQ